MDGTVFFLVLVILALIFKETMIKIMNSFIGIAELFAWLIAALVVFFALDGSWLPVIKSLCYYLIGSGLEDEQMQRDGIAWFRIAMGIPQNCVGSSPPPPAETTEQNEG